MRLLSETKTLKTLFSGNMHVSVPEFQRNYAWESAQVDVFFDDVKSAAISGENHFFGPIVIMQSDHDDSKAQLIDGQQRITTSIMLLCILRDRIMSYPNPYVQVNGHQIALTTLVDTTLYDSNYHESFQAGYQIANVFKAFIFTPKGHPDRRSFSSMTGVPPAEKLAAKQLKSVYLRLEKQLSAWLTETCAGDELREKAAIRMMTLALTENMQLLVMSVFNEDDAYQLFETLNDRGLRLTPSDILKSFTLNKVRASGGNFDDALNLWDNAVTTVEEQKFDFTKFLRHYLLSEQPEKVQVKKIFKLFDKIIDNLGTNGALKNLRNVHAAAMLYSKFLRPDNSLGNSKVQSIVARLNDFSETHRVVLLKLFSNSYEDSQLLPTLKAIENLAFRWILVGFNAQDLESLYQDMANILKSPKDLAKLEEVKQLAMTSLPADELVREVIRSSSAKPDMRRYLLERLHSAQTGAALVVDVDIEHLAPKKPETDFWFIHVAPRNAGPDEDVYDDFLNKWGNLVLLEVPINRSIQNNSWDEKKNGHDNNKGLKHSAIDMTKGLAVLPEWNKTMIESRTAWVGNAAVEMTSNANLGREFVQVAQWVELDRPQLLG
jgi:hypothetical protein